MYVVQGWVIDAPETLARIGLPEGETVVKVPKALMRHLPEEKNGAADS